MRLGLPAWLAMAAVALAAGVGCGQPAMNMGARDIVDRSAEAMRNATAMHIKFDVVGGTMLLGQNFHIRSAEGDILKPGQMQVRAQTNFAAINLPFDILSVDGKQYITNPLNKQWTEVPGGLAGLTLFDPVAGVPSLIARAKDLKKMAPETVDGVRCVRVDGTLESDDIVAFLGPDVAGHRLSATALIGADDFLVRQVRLAGQLQAGEPAGLTRVLTVSRFNQPARIASPPPAPTPTPE